MSNQANNYNEITLIDSFQSLRENHILLCNRFFSSEYCLWLGSGISNSRYPSLKVLLKRLLNILWERSDHEHPDTCPYLDTLLRIIRISLPEATEIPPEKENWDEFVELVIPNLRDNYQQVLNESVPMPAGALDLALDILDLIEIYSNPDIPTDAEHQFIALLAAEGFIKEIVTTNWDPLIEKAAQEIFWTDDTVHVITNSGLFNDIPTQKILIITKTHGCANYVAENPQENKEYLVYSTTSINEWIHEPRWAPFRDRARHLIRQYGAIFIGLSARDVNIQQQYFASLWRVEKLSFNPPKIVFSSTTISPDHRAVLATTYENYANNQTTIDNNAKVPIAAKPLLGSLYIYGLLQKSLCLLKFDDDDFFTDDIYDNAEIELNEIVSNLAEKIDTIEDSEERWRHLALHYSALISKFNIIYKNKFDHLESNRYLPLIDKNIPTIEANKEDNKELGHPMLILILAILQHGQRNNRWQLTSILEDNSQFGQFILVNNSIKRSIQISDNSVSVPAKLIDTPHLNNSANNLAFIIYTKGQEPKLQRTTSPNKKYTGTNGAEFRQIWLNDIFNDCNNWEEITESLSNKLLII